MQTKPKLRTKRIERIIIKSLITTKDFQNAVFSRFFENTFQLVCTNLIVSIFIQKESNLICP